MRQLAIDMAGKKLLLLLWMHFAFTIVAHDAFQVSAFAFAPLLPVTPFSYVDLL